jgi:predicted dehydrogenase
MKKVRLGIIGMGGMGRNHYKNLKTLPEFEITALSDVNLEGLAGFPEKKFKDADSLIASGLADAVLIATPHYFHAPQAVAALNAGLHVLVEKPVAVHVNEVKRMIAAHRDKSRAFAANFNMRANPVFRKIKQVIQAGELGPLQRVGWICTDWFRSNTYFASAGWRATWAGEGGGTLLNQCPHTLDLFQWFAGMPRRITCLAGFGKYHPIEVEDEVTAVLEYESGMTAVFVASTGETPGTNRLEIAGDRGRLVYEDEKLRFLRNEVPTSEHIRTTQERFAPPPVWEVSIPAFASTWIEQYTAVYSDFYNAIQTGGKVGIAPAREGMHSLELANAMLLSAWLGRPVTLPLDGDLYEAELKKRIRTSKFAPPKPPKGGL